MENIENNKLIAEFMGYKQKKCKNGLAWDCGMSIPSNDHLFPIQGRLVTINCEYLKFNSLWDWLIPVIERMTRLALEFDKQGNDLFLKVGESLCKMSGIDNIYLRVVDFIKWYNKQVEYDSQNAHTFDREPDLK